jgi:predicted MFS family arabinose efflux permease
MSEEGRARSGYGELLRTPGVPRIVGSAALASVGALGRPVAILLYAREHSGSFSTAGLVLAAFTAGALVSGPLRGRRLDRSGFSMALLPLGLLSAAFTAAIVLAGELAAPPIVLAAAALAAGGTTPPVGPALRSLWSKLLGEDARLPVAYALTTMLNEIGFFLGPLLAGLLIAVSSPGLAIAVAAAAVLAGTTLFALAPATRESASGGEPARFSPIRAPGVRTILITAAAFGGVFGAVEVALPAFAVEHGDPSAGGFLLAALSPGIVVGGFIYGRRAGDELPSRLYWRLCLLATVGLVPLALANSIAALLALTVIAGAAFAPVTTCQWALIDLVAPQGTAVETTSWLTTMYLVGSVAGSAAAGLLSEQYSSGAALLLSIGGGTVATIVAAGRAPTLIPSSR